MTLSFTFFAALLMINLIQFDRKLLLERAGQALVFFSTDLIMLLFIGLGNPGRRYAQNRHNIGFMAIDAIAGAHRFAPFRARFQGRAAEGEIGGVRSLLLQPETFMNDSGRSVAEAARFYKIALTDIIVFHDELDLASGKCRVKIGGGDAGHNGLRSISAHMGPGYKRVRLGIDHPGDKNLVHAYVLGDFAQSEEEWVRRLCQSLADNAALLAKGDDAGFQNKIHLSMEPAR